MTSRLNKLLQALIHRDQVGLIPYRQALDDIRYNLNIIQASHFSSSNVSILALDIEKTFCSYLLSCKLGIPPLYLSTAIQLCCIDCLTLPTSCVTLIHITRYTGQGSHCLPWPSNPWHQSFWPTIVFMTI